MDLFWVLLVCAAAFSAGWFSMRWFCGKRKRPPTIAHINHLEGTEMSTGTEATMRPLLVAGHDPAPVVSRYFDYQCRTCGTGFTREFAVRSAHIPRCWKRPEPH